jgi:MFS family permease
MPTAEFQRPSGVRFGVLALVALAATNAYMTRSLGAANTTIGREMEISDTEMGTVLGAFNLGYLLCQIPGGLAASFWGVRRTLALSAAVWSVCTIWASFSRNPAELSAARMALGVAQAAMVPCIAKVVADWFPIGRRGVTSAVIAAAMQLGSIAASALTAILLEPLGWRITLQCYAFAGLAWSGAFWWWFRDFPTRHRQVNEAELASIAEGRATDDTAGPAAPALLGWPLVVAMLGSLSFWAFCIQAYCRAYAYELFSTWFAPLLEKGYAVEVETAGQLASLPTTAILVGSLFAGVVVDRVFQRTQRSYLSRSGSAMVGMLLSGLAFLAVIRVRDAQTLVLIVSIGAVCSALANPATWATAMDLGGRYTAVLMAVMNMVGSLGAFHCPRHVGALFDHVAARGDSRWDLVLWLFAGINLAAAVAWLLVLPTDRIRRLGGLPRDHGRG